MAMFRFQASLHSFKFDEDRFTKAFEKAALILIKKAAREWIKAVIIRIGTWTGFAKGSIKFARGPFGDLGSFLRVSIPINKNKEYIRTGRPRFYYGNGDIKVPKTPERGGIRGRYNFTQSQGRHRFFYRSDTVHMVANVFYKNAEIPSTSKEAMRAGAKAFRAYIRAHAGDLPRVRDYIGKMKLNEGKWQKM